MIGNGTRTLRTSGNSLRAAELSGIRYGFYYVLYSGVDNFGMNMHLAAGARIL